MLGSPLASVDVNVNSRNSAQKAKVSKLEKALKSAKSEISKAKLLLRWRRAVDEASKRSAAKRGKWQRREGLAQPVAARTTRKI